jgi:hypothetical protein
MAEKGQADMQTPHPLHRATSMIAGSSGSNLTIARTLHRYFAEQGSQILQMSQSISAYTIIRDRIAGIYFVCPCVSPSISLQK